MFRGRIPGREHACPGHHQETPGAALPCPQCLPVERVSRRTSKSDCSKTLQEWELALNLSVLCSIIKTLRLAEQGHLNDNNQLSATSFGANSAGKECRCNMLSIVFATFAPVSSREY